MKRRLLLLLIICLSTLLMVNPALAARGGNGAKSGSSNGNSGAKSESSMKESKGDTQTGNIKSTNPSKQSKNRVLGSMNEAQQKIAKEKIAQKRNATMKKEFTDTEEHWAQKNIDKVQSLGLISGYQDGSFQPDSAVTSAEAMVMTVNLAETLGTDQLIQTNTTTDTNVTTDTPATTDTSSTAVTTEGGTAVTTDVPQWAQGKAQKASKLGIVNMNRFHSGVQASRAQTAVMLAKALNLEPVDTTNSTFSDSILISAEDLGYILALKEAGIISGTPDGKFNPNSSITRAEIASMLEASVEAAEGDESTDETTDTTTGTDTTTPGKTTDTTTGTDTTTPATTGTTE